MDKKKPVNIDKTVETPMTDLDIKHYIPKPTIKYCELSKYKTIEDLLPNKKDCQIMLIESDLNSGHWVALLRYGNTIEYFDSYGGSPSSPLKWNSKEQNEKLNQSIPYLDKLLSKTKKKVIYNDIDYQKESNNINSCGAHCVFRCLQLLKNGLNLKEYNDLMKKAKKKTKLDYDKIVSAFINLRE